ncbi:MAG: hypothetical protein U0R19_19750 [Bryobacteraceae bacterium]
METIFRDYSPKGVRFFYLYKALAHPDLHSYITPVTLEERLKHIREAKRTLGSQIPWLCDTMTNELKHALADAPNSEFLINPEGKIVARRAWSDPDALRKDLEEHIGKVERVTQVSDLGMKTAEPPKHAPTGIVPRLTLSERYRSLRAEPQFAKTKNPFYVKLRAEADPALLRSGKGKLYLGFYLDPIYGVHWNNEAAPVSFEVFAPEGATVTPGKGRGPKLEQPADADPREFLLEADRGAATGPFRVSFRYYACTDTWCIPLTQEYLVHWDADRDGGIRQSGNPAASGPMRLLNEYDTFDRNKDGKLSKDELPVPMAQRFSMMDANADGFLDRAEVEAMAERFRNQGPPRKKR